MLTFLLFLFILGVLIIVHEFGHFMAAKRIGIKVDEFSLGFGPKIFSRKDKATEYNVCLIPLGGYVKLAGDNLEEYKGGKDEYLTQPVGKRFWVIFSGPLLNYIAGFLFFWLILFVGYPTLTTKIGGLIDGFGAKEAGLQVGDKILSVDGKRVEFWEDLQKEIQSKKTAAMVKLSLLRDAQEYDVNVRIREKALADELGEKRKVGLIGITPYDEIVIVKHGGVESFLLGINKTWELTALTYKMLWRLIGGKISVRDSVTGPLGIFYITSQVARLGIIAILHLIAVLNVSLGIFNLLPLPILDGGHIVLLAIEKIRGRYLSLKSERIITRVGLTIMIALAILVTYNDILRFQSKIFGWLK